VEDRDIKSQNHFVHGGARKLEPHVLLAESCSEAQVMELVMTAIERPTVLNYGFDLLITIQCIKLHILYNLE
jgi:hypothetical protein